MSPFKVPSSHRQLASWRGSVRSPGYFDQHGPLRPIPRHTVVSRIAQAHAVCRRRSSNTCYRLLDRLGTTRQIRECRRFACVDECSRSCYARDREIDSHWRQRNLTKIAKHFSDALSVTQMQSNPRHKLSGRVRRARHCIVRFDDDPLSLLGTMLNLKVCELQPKRTGLAYKQWFRGRILRPADRLLRQLFTLPHRPPATYYLSSADLLP